MRGNFKIGKFSGGHDSVASTSDNPEAVALFKLNGKEEVQHGHRVQRAMEFLTG